MILSNTAIFEALDDGRLVLDPEPQPRIEVAGGPESPFDTTAVDLRLGPYLSTPKRASKVIIDLARPGGVTETLDALTETVEFPAGHQLEPREFLLGQTLETIHLALPEEFSEEAQGKPSWRPASRARVPWRGSDCLSISPRQRSTLDITGGSR